MMRFIRTTAVDKLLTLTKRKKIVPGGSSAGKTYAILAILIDKAARKPGLEISVISESIPHLKRGALKDFIKVMKWTGRWVEDRYNATDRVYRFANGSYIEFYSPESVLGARRNILYINECINVSYADYHQLAVRTSDEIWLDFNPANEFWVHSEVMIEPDAEVCLLTYADNEALPPNVINDFTNAKLKAQKEQIEGKEGYWTNWCKVYIDGGLGSLQGVVFEIKIVKEIPSSAKRLGYGIDWGYSIDPTVLLDVFQDGQNLYLDQLIYSNALTNADIINRMNELEVSKQHYIIADSAEPKSIEDLKRGGYSLTRPAQKGADSVRNSIDKLQQFTIHLTERSVESINDFRMYMWEQDKSGKYTGNPVDAYNHAPDALRYASNLLNKSTKFDYEFVVF